MANYYEALKNAQKISVGITAPLVFSIEGMRKSIIAAHELMQPVILRVDMEYIDVDDVIFWKNEYSEHYPCAKVFVVVENVKTFEESMRILAKDVDGISLVKGLGEEVVGDIYSVTSKTSVLLEKTVCMGCLESGKTDNCDIVRVSGVAIDDSNVDEMVSKLRKLTTDKNKIYAINDFVVSKPEFKKIKQMGITKFDIFETVSEDCMDKLETIMNEDKDHGDRFFMLKLVSSALSTYGAGVKDRMYYLGQFILR